MFFVIIVIAAIVCLPFVVIILTRPAVPKKYPIFSQYDSIENHYSATMSQLRTAANDSLSLYSSYNEEAFSQLVHNIQSKLHGVLNELEAFDDYWGRFVRFKAQSSYVAVCRSYSTDRRNQITSARQFLEDVLPFMRMTNDLRVLRQKANAISIASGDAHAYMQIQNQIQHTRQLRDNIEAVQAHHQVTAQYRQYILSFLSSQMRQLEAIPQTNSSHQIEAFYSYVDSWGSFNDSHSIDLINDEFSWQIDKYQQAMDELRTRTDYDS